LPIYCFLGGKYFVGCGIILIFAKIIVMMKKLLIYTLFSAMLFAVPSVARASEPEELFEEQIDVNRISITVSQSTLYVNGANGLVLEVVSLTGRPVASVKIESSSQRIELNLPKGCYILKVGKVVRKVSIR
jgi:hypothetical protein